MLRMFDKRISCKIPVASSVPKDTIGAIFIPSFFEQRSLLNPSNKIL